MRWIVRSPTLDTALPCDRLGSPRAFREGTGTGRVGPGKTAVDMDVKSSVHLPIGPRPPRLYRKYRTIPFPMLHTASSALTRYPFRSGHRGFTGPMPLPIASAVRIASATYLFAAPAASLAPSPSTTLLSSALENAHPVPWVDRLTICSPVSQNISPLAGANRSSGGFRCPP